jgi:choline dehydrogenase-like flavoprotein
MTYARPEDVQVDLWEKVGNPGLNWNSLLPYFKKSEMFQVPNADQRAAGAIYDADAHGLNGPLNVGWQIEATGNASFIMLNETWSKIGVPFNHDINSGKARGFATAPSTVDSSTDIREDSARAYYWPIVAQRKNLFTFVNTTANKMVWDKTAYRGKPRASGVIVTTMSGEVKTLTVKKEVVVSLGTMRSGPFLEFSGIGNPK